MLYNKYFYQVIHLHMLTKITHICRRVNLSFSNNINSIYKTKKYIILLVTFIQCLRSAND